MLTTRLIAAVATLSTSLAFGPARADVVDDLAGMTVHISGKQTCRSSPRAENKIGRIVDVRFPSYIASSRRLTLYVFGSRPRDALTTIPDGRWRTSRVAITYNDRETRVPVHVRAVASAHRISVSYQLDFESRWPDGARLRHKRSGSGEVVLSADLRSCRVVNYRFSDYLTDDNHVVVDHTCTASSVPCSVAKGRPN